VGVGALLQAWRARALLTQEELAERAGLSVRTVRRLESDAAARPQSSTLRRLVEALGLGPAQLQELAAAARSRPHGDPPALRPSRGEPPERAGPAALRQLPAPPPLFTGRAPELTELERAHDPIAVVVATIDGMAGIGKTALALHAAHRLSGAYSDGQLFLDLHGYTQNVEPVQPGEALARLLRALGVPRERIPAHPQDRAALYRSRLAGRKMLVVLDNAVSEAQVRPLLPGTPGAMALVTSRRRLIELDHTLTVSLDVLPQPDAVALFARSAGVGADDAGVAGVVDLCGRLPLALRIAAARLRSRPTWAAGHLLERLRDRQQRLGELDLGELDLGERSVAAALDVSYLQLDPDLQRAYRLCGPLPESAFDVHVAAALVDATVDRAARLLDALVDVNLLQELVPGRFTFHDLVRSHAGAAAAREEPDRPSAFGRMFDYYSHTASVAMDVLFPHERERRPPAPPAGTPIPDLRGADDAAAWLDLELPNLLTAARYAARFCPRNHPVHLSTTLDRYLRARGRDVEAEVLHQQALTVARRNGERAGEADVLTSLGHVSRRQGRTARAADHYGAALTVARSAGNRRAEVDALLGLGRLMDLQGRHEAAVDHIGRALELATDLGLPVDQARAHDGLARVHHALGRREEAQRHWRAALDVLSDLGPDISRDIDMDEELSTAALRARLDAQTTT
jgi:transcriptional regulator with XRE-family HTH domain/tetratricopeptide (TPR) repeat protein